MSEDVKPMVEQMIKDELSDGRARLNHHFHGTPLDHWDGVPCVLLRKSKDPTSWFKLKHITLNGNGQPRAVLPNGSDRPTDGGTHVDIESAWLVRDVWLQYGILLTKTDLKSTWLIITSDEISAITINPHKWVQGGYIVDDKLYDRHKANMETIQRCGTYEEWEAKGRERRKRGLRGSGIH